MHRHHVSEQLLMITYNMTPVNYAQIKSSKVRVKEKKNQSQNENEQNFFFVQNVDNFVISMYKTTLHVAVLYTT